MAYQRTVAQRAGDFAGAREWELEVQTALGEFVQANLDSPTKLDFYVPGFYLDAKEKNQRYGKRFCPDQSTEPNSFILDELSVRKAVATGATNAYFLIRDNVHEDGPRLFLARVDEAFCAPKRLYNRTGNTGVKKGKWVIDLLSFRQLPDMASLFPTIMRDQLEMGWKASSCISHTEVPEA